MVGRFTSVDPAKDGLNWYAYCNCNPVMYTDTSGLSADNANKPIYKQSAASMSADIAFYELFGVPKSMVASSITTTAPDMLKTAGELIAAAIATMFADGPLPFADIVAGGIIIVAGGIFIYAYGSMAIDSLVVLAKGKQKKLKVPSKLKKDDGSIKTPDSDPNEFKKNKDGTFTHKKTDWTFDRAKGWEQHGGPHWDAYPSNGSGHLNIGPEGNIF